MKRDCVWATRDACGWATCIIGVITTGMLGMSTPSAHAQCDLLLRETFRFGERPHGGNGRVRVVELEDRLHDYWPQASSIGARWISADQAPQALWQFAWSSADPAEVDPPEGPDGNGTAFGEAGAAAMIAFAAPTGAFTTAVDVTMANGVLYFGYTTTTAFLDNFEADGALWMSVDAGGHWSVRVNGNTVVAAGTSLGGGVLDGGFYRHEFTFDPVTSMVSGLAAGEPFGPIAVTLSRPLSYFGMEARESWCVVNNLTVFTGNELEVNVDGPSTVCVGGIATLSATSNATAPAGYFWLRDGRPMLDGMQPSGAMVTGAGTPTMVITGLQEADLGGYRCVVTNECGLEASGVVMLEDCRADQNCDGSVNSADFFEFLTAFFNGDLEADVNSDGSVSSQDFFDFVSAFFAGC